MKELTEKLTEWLRERTEYVPQLYETEKTAHKASDAAENLQLFGSVARGRHARPI